MNRVAIVLIFALATPWVQACEPGLGAKMLISANDKNGDGVLTASEWKSVGTDGFQVDFKTGDPGVFKRLDNNRNGKLEWQELENVVRLKASPCKGWPWKE